MIQSFNGDDIQCDKIGYFNDMVISTFNVVMLDISMRCDFNIQCDDVGNFNATVSTLSMFLCSADFLGLLINKLCVLTAG